MICTFYSYKGGVGRTMALANVADIMAREGLRVLMIDFDLEAPGLEKFFDVNYSLIRAREGLLDLLLDYKLAMSKQAPEAAETQRFRKIEEFIVPIYQPLASGGRLNLMPAGRRGHQAGGQEDADQLSRYALNLRTFDWQDFYFNWAGEAFFEWLRNALREAYDLVLVDSRTGVTEMGGICAYQLADAWVMFCATNQQNIEGTQSVARNLESARVRALRGNRPLPIVIVPARVEIGNASLQQGFQDQFERTFADYTPEALRQAKETLWSLRIPYEPRYAFQEQVVADLARQDERRHVASAYRRLARAIARLAAPGSALAEKWFPPGAEDAATEVVQPRYDPTRRYARVDALLSYGGDAEDVAQDLAQKLGDAGFLVESDRWPDVPSDVWHAAFTDRLFHCRTCFVLIGAAGAGPWRGEALGHAAAERITIGDLAVVPVLLPGADGAARSLPTALRHQDAVDLRSAPGDGQALVAIVAATRTETRTPAAATTGFRSPYVGLRPFNEQDATLFFGREELIERLSREIAGTPFLAVMGPSGSGKSSLVLAGLFPALRAGAVPGSDEWLLRTMRPGSAPIESLAHALAPDDAEQVAGRLTAGKDVLVELVREILPSDREREEFAASRLLLFVDQFEEIFTQCQNEQERQRFLNLILTAVAAPHSPLILLIAIRADYYGECLKYPDLAGWLESRIVAVPPMSSEELRAAIEKPAQQVGLAFEPGLVERILIDVGSEPGALPQLAFLLLQLSDGQRDGRLTHDAYDRIGGVKGALTQRAEETFAGLTPAQRETARGIFMRLVRLDTDQPDSRLQVALSELRAVGGYPFLFDDTVRHLVEARLLTVTSEAEGDDPRVDIAHEALVRDWTRLRDWLDEDRAALLAREAIRDAAREWEERGREESYLARGQRLEQAQGLQEQPWLGLSALEREFLAESRALRDREEQEREAQRRLELESARERARLADLARHESEQRMAEQAVAAERLRRRLVMVAALGVLALVLAGFALYQFSRANTGFQLAQEQRAVAESEALVARAQALGARAGLQHELGQDERGALLARQAYLFDEQAGRPNSPATDAALRAALGAPYFNRALPGHADAVNTVAFSPDGATLASGSNDGTVRLWRPSEPGPSTILGEPGDAIAAVAVSTNAQVPAVGRGAPVNAVAFSPVEGIVAVGRADGTVRLWDLAGRDPPETVTDEAEAINSMAFNPDGRLLATGSSTGAVRLHDLDRPGEGRIVLGGVNGLLTYIAFSPDGRSLAAGRSDGVVQLWTVADPDDPVLISAAAGQVTAIAFSPDGQTLATGSGDGTVNLWALSDPDDPVVLDATADVVSSLAFGPDRATLAVGSRDGTLQLWNVEDPAAAPVTLTGHTSEIASVAFSPDGSEVATGSRDRTVRLWNLVSAAGPVVLTDSPGPGAAIALPFTSVAFNPDGQTVAAGGYEALVRLWDFSAAPDAPIQLSGHGDIVTAVAFGPDGETLASGSLDKTVRLWNMSAPEGSTVLDGAPGQVTAVGFSPDGQSLAAGGSDQTIAIWDLAGDAAAPRVLRGHTNTVTAVAFSPDGTTLASGGSDGTVRLWDRGQAEPVSTILSDAAGLITSVAFSPDGTTLAAGSRDGTVQMWRVAEPGVPVVFAGTLGPITSVAFSPDGTMLAAGTRDATVRVWNANDPSFSPRVLAGGAGTITSVAFGPDGHAVASAGSDGLVRVWIARTEDLAEIVCQQVWRNFTAEEWDQFIGAGVPYEATCPNLPAGDAGPTAPGLPATPVLSAVETTFRSAASG